MEREYSDGIENGLEKEYCEDGTLKQKGTFVNAKEEGVCKMSVSTSSFPSSGSSITGIESTI